MGGVKNNSDLTSITATLNSLLEQFFRLCPSRNIPALSSILEDISKIHKCSTAIHPLTKYSSLFMKIVLQLFKLGNIARKRLTDGKHRVISKIKDLVYDLCLLQTTFSGSDLVQLNCKLLVLYCLQFLRKYVTVSQITDKEIALYVHSVNSFIIKNGISFPGQLKDNIRFDLFKYLLSVAGTIVDSSITVSTATILSPASNIERTNEFPCHLSYSVDLEAETENLVSRDLAVRVNYPGKTTQICQNTGGSEGQLQNYYQNTVFLGTAHSWSHPGTISLSLVIQHSFSDEELALSRLHESDNIWLEISQPVQLKIHPKIPR